MFWKNYVLSCLTQITFLLVDEMELILLCGNKTWTRKEYLRVVNMYFINLLTV
jgi:hypothetical protein